MRDVYNNHLATAANVDRRFAAAAVQFAEAFRGG
jgi:hypothetical protein